MAGGKWLFTGEIDLAADIDVEWLRTQSVLTAMPTHRQFPIPRSDADFTSQTFRFVALDVETANEQSNSICQIGLAMVRADGTILQHSFLVDPQQPFSAFNTDLHGISAATVAGAKGFAAAVQPLRAFLERHPLVQHSSFDKGAMDAACKLAKLPALRVKWHDSVVIARQAWPELKGNGGHGLASLKNVLGIEFQHHDAGEDARAAAIVVLEAEKATGEPFNVLSLGAKRHGRKYVDKVSIEGKEDGALYGHVACFTGQLTMSRIEAATFAAGAGITVKTSMSRKITLLVVGDQDLTLLLGHEKSSKHRIAEDLAASGHGIRIIGETEFLALLNP